MYPGRITRVDIKVEGEPEEDKLITVEIEIHGESDLDAAQSAYIRVFSEKGTFFDLAWMSPVDANGMSVASGHTLRGQATLSRYAANGYWGLMLSESGMHKVMKDNESQPILGGNSISTIHLRIVNHRFM